MRDITQLLDQPDTTVAVVGATDDPSKYGYTIYRDLKRKGFIVYPVNPNRTTVDGDPAFVNLAAIPERPTIANLVVPPEVTLGVLAECLVLRLMDVWLQPGSESPQVMGFLQTNGFNYLANACIMVVSRLKS